MIRIAISFCLLALLAVPAANAKNVLGTFRTRYDYVTVYTMRTPDGPMAYVCFGEKPPLRAKLQRTLGTPYRALKAVSRKIKYAGLFLVKPGDYWLRPQEADLQ